MLCTYLYQPNYPQEENTLWHWGKQRSGELVAKISFPLCLILRASLYTSYLFFRMHLAAAPIHLTNYKEGRRKLLRLAVWCLAPTLATSFEAHSTVRLGARCMKKRHRGNETFTCRKYFRWFLSRLCFLCLRYILIFYFLVFVLSL